MIEPRNDGDPLGQTDGSVLLHNVSAIWITMGFPRVKLLATASLRVSDQRISRSSANVLRIAQATTEDEFQAAMRLRAEMGQWDATQSQQLGLNPEEVLKVFYPTDEYAARRENTPPAGGLLIANYAQKTAGCAAFRRLDANACELHHVFVRNQFRGIKIGRLMLEQLIGMAREVGYEIMRLETTTFMTQARALYASVGFKLSHPYYELPKAFERFAVFMELPLSR